MNIITYCILCFIVATAYWLFNSQRLRNIFLLACSIIFVLLYCRFWTIFFIALITFIYFSGAILTGDDRQSRVTFRFMLVFLVATLCFFKYAGFIFNSIIRTNSPVILLPFGLSYIIFRLIHYIVEVRRRAISPGSFVEIALYTLFFPTFLAGPVERFPRFPNRSLLKNPSIFRF